ncbi:T-cell differentiation antigen CD6 isoform X2 [Ctenopharyngodon idella]|uniref:T-cell differentiation antigen CD6 isoform X2 n=1 Tax=Ctenopharyngodon idella TaxID=7959 RepID=UPI0022328077|nr:T-cell differentiation antigen CD6 isoform X2 [Ctenopharyngodon idella]
MPLLLLCVVLQALSVSQGLNGTDARQSVEEHADKPIELSTLSLSNGCSGVLSALHQNTTVDLILNPLDEENKKLALQICERFNCGHVFKINTTATVHNVTCILNNSKLHNCTTAAEGDCTVATEVICEHQVVRLVGGQDRCAGRVELLHSGQWGTVCDDDFNITSGQVVCAQLRCGSAKRVDSFGAGSRAIHISKMKCNGTERNLWECGPINNTAGYCGHKEDAGIVCSESVEITNTNSTTELELTTPVTVTTAVAATERIGGVSAAAIGCIILSIALFMFIMINSAVCVHFKRAKACVINQHHSSSYRSLEDQPNEQIGVYNTQIVPAARGHQYESLGPRMSSNYGRKFSKRTNQPTHNSDTDSEQEHHNSVRPQRLHLNNSPRDMNDGDSTCSGEGYEHNVQINMDTIKSGDKPPLSFVAPHTYSQDDSSSTSSGEFYQNNKTDTDNIPKSRAETQLLHEKSPLTLLSFDDHHLPGTESKVDVNDSSSTSSGEFYQNTETDIDNNFKSREEAPSLHENSQFAPLSYGDSQAVDVNDSSSTSSDECYQNTEIDMDNILHCEDEESPSLLEKSLQTSHSTQMTGNSADYSGCHVPRAHSRDGNDSDSTSSEECYQNTEIGENALLYYGEESPSLPEMSFQNPHIAQMTESTDGYEDQHVPRNLSQETDSSSTASEASYVNVPSKNEMEDNSDASSDNDYVDTGNW